MPPVIPKTSDTYWRGVPEAELAALLPAGLPEANRRRFLKLMGASLALASAAGCHRNNPTWPRWPKANILPHAHRAEGHDPGRPLHYATMMELAGEVLALTGSASPLRYQPLPKDDPKMRKPDITIARTVLGWEPKVPMKTALKKTLDAFLAEADASRGSR